MAVNATLRQQAQNMHGLAIGDGFVDGGAKGRVFENSPSRIDLVTRVKS